MAAGRSADAAAWRSVETCLCGIPLWLGPPDAGAPRGAVAVGVDDLVSRLAELVPGEAKPARAFGRPWQVVVTERGLLAPGVPGPVAAAEDRLDARYWRDGDSIVREAQARVATEVASPGEADDAAPVRALWFSTTERWCLFDHLLEVSNLHFRAVLPATAATVARVVAATAPALAASTGGWPTTAAVPPTSLEVGREAALLGVGWDDPDRFLAARLEVEAVRGAGRRRCLRLVSGDQVEVAVSAATTGFTLTVESGRWLYARLAVGTDGDRVEVRVEPAADVDLVPAATRARLAFDLTATLLALSR